MAAGSPQRDFIADWTLERGRVEILSEGRMGAVRRGLYTGTPVAIKRITRGEAEWREMLVEVEGMLRLSHPLVVQLLGVLQEEDGGKALVTELAPGSLHDLLHADLKTLESKNLDPTPWRSPRKSTLSLGFDVAMMLDCVAALDFLHSLNMPHRNVKASNVLVFHGFRCKLCDFGLRKRVNEDDQPSASSAAGSLKVSLATDVHAMGDLVRIQMSCIDYVAHSHPLDERGDKRPHK